MAKIELCIHKTELEKHLAHAITDVMRQNASKSILFLVSGGSARSVLEYLDPTVLGSHLTVTQVDERFSREEGVSNHIQLSHTQFYTNAQARGVAFISSLPEKGERIDVASKRWEDALRAWEATHSQDRMVVALMGMGLDGHVGGIIPMPDDPDTFRNLFEDTTNWIVGYDAGDKNQYALRMTTTISFLKTKVDCAFLFVKGAEKEPMLKTILKSRDIPLYPVTVIHAMEHVSLYTTIECSLNINHRAQSES